jgi:putative peptidoglycan lipid II flippase
LAESEASPPNSVLESAVIFASGTLLSRILGLVRDVIIARYFSVDVRDAFVNAFRLPNVFRRIFGEGALSASFIPVFLEVLSSREFSGDEREVRRKKLLAGVFTILLLIVGIISILATIFMEDLLRFLLGGNAYMNIPGKFELTVRLARIMFSFLVLITVFSYFMAILNGLHKFALTALAPCFFNLTIVLSAMFLSRGNSTWLAWSVIAGGFMQMAVLAIGLMREGYFPKLSFDWDSPEIGQVAKAILPATLGFSLLQLTAIVNMRFASELAPGSHSYLYLADRIFELPLSLFVVSIGSALLPTLSKHWAEGDKTAMSVTINHCVRLIVFVALPAAIGMFVMAQPIAEVLFLGREFKYDDAVRTGQIIQVYSFGLVIAAGVRILSQGFYAIQNVWFPAAAALVALISHTILAFVLTKAFGLNGLASASVLSSSVNLLMLAFAYNAWVGDLGLKDLVKSVAKYSAAIVIMVGALQVYGPLQRIVGAARPGSRAFVLLSTISLGAAAFLFASALLQIPEFREMSSTLTKRLKNVQGRVRRRKSD